MGTHAPARDNEMVAALEDVEQALRTPGGAGAAGDAAVARLASVAGPELRDSTRQALRVALGSGRPGPLWDDAFRVVRTSRRPWVVAVSDRTGPPLPRLLWTEPWPQGERHVAWSHGQVPSATRRLYRYAGAAPDSVRLVARRLRHPGRAGLLHPLGRLGLSPCGSTVGCLCCPATELLLASDDDGACDTSGAFDGGGSFDNGDAFDEGGARARWIALAGYLGREGPLHRSGLASRTGSPADRAAATVTTGLTAAWLYLSTATPPPYPSVPGPHPEQSPGRATDEAATLAVWGSYTGTHPWPAATGPLREGARRLLRDAVAALRSPAGAAHFADWTHRSPETFGRGRHGAATTNEEE